MKSLFSGAVHPMEHPEDGNGGGRSEKTPDGGEGVIIECHGDEIGGDDHACQDPAARECRNKSGSDHDQSEKRSFEPIQKGIGFERRKRVLDAVLNDLAFRRARGRDFKRENPDSCRADAVEDPFEQLPPFRIRFRAHIDKRDNESPVEMGDDKEEIGSERNPKRGIKASLQPQPGKALGELHERKDRRNDHQRNLPFSPNLFGCGIAKARQQRCARKTRLG